MKLIEIYKSATKGKTLQQYIQSIIQSGDYRIKSGAYGIVLIPPDTNFVYKVWSEDFGFESWIKVCQANQDNKYIPKIFGRIKIIPNIFVRDIFNKNTNIKIVKMEKLQPLPTKYHYIFSNIDRIILSDDYSHSIFEEEPELKQTIQEIYNLVKSNKLKNLSIDLHDGNVMVNNVGQFKVIDGFVGWEKNTVMIKDLLDDTQLLSRDHEQDKNKLGVYITGRGDNTKQVPSPFTNDVDKLENWLDIDNVIANDWSYVDLRTSKSIHGIKQICNALLRYNGYLPNSFTKYISADIPIDMKCKLAIKLAGGDIDSELNSIYKSDDKSLSYFRSIIELINTIGKRGDLSLLFKSMSNDQCDDFIYTLDSKASDNTINILVDYMGDKQKWISIMKRADVYSQELVNKIYK